ncbi:MAG: Mov34/MPN/PAD-1 family protein [Candidatus Woesearchaeota archaeon]
MTEKFNEYLNTNTTGNQNTGNHNVEYQSPDTELKFLEALVNEDKSLSTTNSATYKITNGAFNKAMTYAKAIGQLAGTGMECYGYLLKPADSLDNVVTDIFLAPNQTNQSAYVRVSAEGVYQSSQEIEPKGLMIVGWWHSHGTFSTFHSGTDVRNFEIVLHSIAPRTMYKNEKAQYTYNKDTKELMITGVKLKGIELPDDAQLDVIRKVEQDPYAYSMVVNMRREYYLEKISKKLISKEAGFKLFPPIRPTLELVTIDNDVKYTISEIEDDITGKVEIHNNYSNNHSNGYSNNYTDLSKKNASFFNLNKTNKINIASTYKNKLISKFIENLKSETPEYLNAFIEGIINKDNSILSKLPVSSEKVSDLSKSSDIKSENTQANSNNAADSNNQSNLNDKTNSNSSNTILEQNSSKSSRSILNSKKVNLEELSTLLNERFENIPERYNSNKVYDIHNLREEIALHFINEYSLNPSQDIVTKFAKINNALSENFDISVNAGKALSKYSMERFTDYNNECKHKYKNFIGHFLSNMDTTKYVSLDSSFDVSKNSKYDKATEELFLYHNRLRIINNMLTTLTFKSNQSKFKSFFSEFSSEYQKNPESEKLDLIIEQKLLSPMGVNDFSTYVDRVSYERKGIITNIFSEVKKYFGGSKNVKHY